MGSGGGIWDEKDRVSKDRLNRKNILIETAASLISLAKTIGQFRFPTSTSSPYTQDIPSFIKADGTTVEDFLTRTLAQIMTNKTFNMTNNTLEDDSDAQGDLVKHSGTKFVKWAKGTAHQHPRVNTGATDLEYADGVEILGSVTASGGETALAVSSLPDKNFYAVFVEIRGQTNLFDLAVEYNDDTGTNYSYEIDSGDGTPETGVSQANASINGGNTPGASSKCLIDFLIYNNQAGDRKLHHGTYITDNNTAATAAPVRRVFYGKWNNTSAVISKIEIIRFAGTGTFAAGSCMVVVGWN